MVSLPLALNGDQQIALLGILVGLAGTIGALIFAYFNGRSARAEAHKLARGSRLHSQRLDAYTDLSAYLERERLHVERTEPKITIGEAQDPPAPLSDEEWIKMQARVSVAGSAAVDTAVKEAQKRAHNFGGAMFVYRAMRDQRGTAIQQTESRDQMDGARDRAIEAIENAQHVMREELANL